MGKLLHCGLSLAIVAALIGRGDAGQRTLKPVPAPLQTDSKERYQLGALDISPDGKMLAVGISRETAGVQGFVQLFALPGGKHVRTLEGKSGLVGAVAFAPDGKSVAASIGGLVQRWDLASGKDLDVLRPSRAALITHLRFSADGARLVGLSDPKHLVVWNALSGQETCATEFEVGQGRAVDFSVSADGKKATVVSQFGAQAQRLDLATGEQGARWSSYPTFAGKVFTRTGELVLGQMPSEDGAIIVAWDLARRKETEVCSSPQAPTQLAAGGDGKRIAAGFEDGSIRIWDRASREELVKLNAHSERVLWLAFSPDDKHLVTGSIDRTVKIWDLGELRSPAPPAKIDRGGEKHVKQPDNEQAALAAKAQQVLRTYCYRCHGQDGAAEGGFNHILDHRRLLESKRIVAGKVAQSRLLKRVLSEEMPPEEEKLRPSSEEIALLKQWVLAGAPDWAPAVKPRRFVPLEEVARLVREDRARHDANDREFFRYVMITHLYNTGQADDELQTLRLALTKVINSVSMGQKIVAPQPIDEAKTIFRLDVRHYHIAPLVWDNEVEGRHPYGLAWRPDPDKAAERLPVRGDWLVFAASRPPLYHVLADIPWTALQLEGRLKVKAAEDIALSRVFRAGFNSSGISRNNRLIERHDAAHGYYWKSYDFLGNAGRQNLFAHPQGPPPGPKTFQHDGGEIIFRLPNGLQAYMLVDGRGNRIDKALSALVSDPKHPDRVVENGISCMSCHTRGIIDKKDQIRAHVQKNPESFTADEQNAILALYPTEEKLAGIYKADAESFQKAVVECGGRVGATEPIVVASLRFEAELDLPQAATELWMTPQDLLSRLDDFPSLARPLGVLRTEGGTVQRQVFIRYFPVLINHFRIAEHLPAPWHDRRESSPSPSPREVTACDGAAFAIGKFQTPGHNGRARRNCPPPTLDPSHKWIAACVDDRTVHVFDAATGAMAAALKSHANGVTALAFSKDGKLLASASRDGRARIWNWKAAELLGETPKRSNPFAIWGLAFTPDGKRLAGTGFGHCEVQIWDVPSGKEQQTIKGNLRSIERVAFAPDGKTLVSADMDSFAVWDVEKWDQGKPGSNRKPRAMMPGRDRPLLAVAFSPDSKRFVTGSANGTIRLWDVATCDQIGVDRLATSERWFAIFAAAYSADGKHLATAHEDGCITLWDAATLRDLIVFRAHPADTLRSVAFSPDGTRLVSTDLHGAVLSWDVRKILRATATP